MRMVKGGSPLYCWPSRAFRWCSPSSIPWSIRSPPSCCGAGCGGERVERVWTPLSDMAPVLVRTVVASEDARYCRHWGVDPEEIRAAIERADDDIEEARGASTIPMQVAKNLFLWNSRSFVRKAIEMPLALWLDLVLSKRRLLEIYLNIAEWGPDGSSASRPALGAPSAWMWLM